MKKVLAFVLVVALTLALSLTAFAAGIKDSENKYLPTDGGSQTLNESNNKASGDVVVKVSNSTEPTVYMVGIEWPELTFTYSTSNQIWDPTKHDYVPTDDNESETKFEPVAITVYNHSNAKIEYTVAFTAQGGVGESATLTTVSPTNTLTVGGVTATLNGDGTSGAKELKSADTEGIIRNYDAADKGTTTLTLTGKPDSLTAGNITIGTITVTVNKVS